MIPTPLQALIVHHSPFITELCSTTGENPYRITALILRESKFGYAKGYLPKGDILGLGDHGHAVGFFQIDKRYHAAFLKCESSKTLMGQGLYAMGILRNNRDWFRRNVAINTGDKERLERMAFAAYNCSCGRVAQAVESNLDIDIYTTKKDYSIWIFNKANEIRKEMPSLYAVPK